MKILIAEDDLVTREMLKRVLRHLAEEIVEAGDGRETLEKLESEDPDFLFADLQLPDLNGYSLLAAVRASPARGRIPVVCMSVARDKNEVTRVLELGVQDYVLKPIRAAEVHDRFRDIIAKHAGWRDRSAVAEGTTAGDVAD